jgi:hypothetical protein
MCNHLGLFLKASYCMRIRWRESTSQLSTRQSCLYSTNIESYQPMTETAFLRWSGDWLIENFSYSLRSRKITNSPHCLNFSYVGDLYSSWSSTVHCIPSPASLKHFPKNSSKFDCVIQTPSHYRLLFYY